MKYYKTYNFAAVFLLIVFSSFVGVLFFWSEPQPADAVQMPQQAVAKQTLSSDNGSSGANLVGVDDVSDGVYSIDNDRESLFMQNPLGELFPIEISADNSGNLPVLTPEMDLDTESGTRIIKSDSADTVASPVAAGGSSGSPSSQGGVPAGGGGGTDSTVPSGGGGSGSPIIQQANYPVFVLPSHQRVLQSEYTITGESSAEIYCAKNETESFQILVANKSSYTLPDIEIIGSGWQPAAASSSKEPVVTLYREHYVRVSKSSYGLKSQTGMYPDALIPFVDPYTNKPISSAKYLANHASVEPHNTQGYWVDVAVGNNVPAGTYTYSFLVTSNDTPLAEVPLTLHVWEFTLPRVPALKSYFGRIINMSAYHGMKSTDAPYKMIRDRYVALVRDHRITVGYYIDPTVNGQTGAVTFSPSFVSQLQSYVDEMKPTVVCLGIYGESSFNGSSYVYLCDNLAIRARYLADWQNFLNNNNWVVNPMIFYDEPRTIEAYNQIIEYGALIHKYAPKIKFLVTEQIEQRKAGFPSLIGSVDIWCPVWYLGNPVSIKSELLKGNEAWSYGTTAPSPKNPVWLIDYPLIEHRIPAWFSMSMGLEGLLYWQTLVWARDGLDPWTTSEIYKSSSWIYNGEGYLIYPGTAAGIDGPVSSMRLKVLRDGMEDYDYLWLLNQKTPTGEGTKIATGVAKSFTQFSRDPDDYLRARENIAQQIISSK
jgi:hypothetical protein